MKVGKAVGRKGGRLLSVPLEEPYRLPALLPYRPSQSGRPDLNRGPPAPEAGALTGLRYTPCTRREKGTGKREK